MSSNTVKDKLNALNRATESFRATKKRKITQICSVGVRHKFLKWPAFLVAVLFILFVNVIFYLCLFILVNKKRAIGIAIVMVAAVGLVVVFLDYNSANRLYERTEENFIIITSTQENEAEELIVSEAVDDVQVPWYEQITVDFDSLKEINADIVGWIYFENEAISYPILKGITNDTYINTTYLGKSSRAGSIFMDSNNASDFEDFHSIIYGHNMRNKSMFGKLSAYYRDTDYYSDHRYFRIITPEKVYRYEIIAAKRINADNPIYDLSNVKNYDADEYVQSFIMNGSILGIGVTACDSDHYITLSTCTSGDERFVVSAFRIDEWDISH